VDHGLDVSFVISYCRIMSNEWNQDYICVRCFLDHKWPTASKYAYLGEHHVPSNIPYLQTLWQKVLVTT